MNIVFFYGSMGVGGAEWTIAAVSRDFADRGDQVSIIVSDDGASAYDIDPRVQLIPLHVAGESRSAADTAKLFLNTGKLLRREVKKLRADVVLAFEPKLAVISRAALMGTGVKVIGLERTNPFVVRTSRREQVIARMCAHADGFIFQTEGAKGFYPRKLQEKSAVIPNGVDPDIGKDQLSYEARPACSAIATGRLAASKNYELIIDAVGEILPDYPDFQLDIYGSGDRKEQIQNYIKVRNLQEHVHLRGQHKNIREELVKHRIFLMASEFEGMPNGLAEAMACGCLCISSDCEFGPSELITQGKDGILFPVGGRDKLISALRNVLADDGYAAKLAGNARSVSRRLDRNLIYTRYHEYVEKIVNSR